MHRDCTSVLGTPDPDPDDATLPLQSRERNGFEVSMYAPSVPSDRRSFLVRTGLVLAAAGYGELLHAGEADAAPAPSWTAVRAQFPLTRRYLHFGGLLLASHPRPVSAAIARHRRGLDANPVHYLHDHQPRLEAAVLRAAASYLGVRPEDIALTDSTTMGLGLLYNGIAIRRGQEIVTTRHDFFATHEALRLAAARTGATIRTIELYESGDRASTGAIVDAVARAMTPRTRVVAVTWVHSSTGVKLPVARIARAVASANRGRASADRILLCVDGVHGLGVENVTLPRLGCDFFVAGCHKWLFGPRGTGIVWGRPDAWNEVRPTIPAFSGGSPAGIFTPGGFHSFEHRWALAEAFVFHRRIGKARVAARIHALNRQLKDGLAGMRHVTLHTPRDEALSAGLVCFSVRGLSPPEVVARLRARRIVATVTPYATSYARLAPGLLNTPAEVDAVLRAVRGLA
jgi:isopenicillin-N epimerase